MTSFVSRKREIVENSWKWRFVVTREMVATNRFSVLEIASRIVEDDNYKK